jgi:hypothetical protein
MKYDDTSWLDPMRNAMGELEQQCHAFGLPGNVGFECWSWKEFAAACKQADAKAIDLFLRTAEKHVRFYMALNGMGLEGEIDAFTPDAHSTSAKSCVKKYRHLLGLKAKRKAVQPRAGRLCRDDLQPALL